MNAGRESLAGDLVVLSDLHLGEGNCQENGRLSPMEDFFHDEAFARLLGHLCAQVPGPGDLTLVLNGDVFDFLIVTRTAGCPGDISDAERKFGLDPTETKSVFKLDAIAAGHPRFFAALSRWVAFGNRVEVLRGNHDLELFFPAVQARLKEHLTQPEGGASGEQVEAGVRFHPWFYLEPGRVYIEHGNQYEASNSIRYPLRPLLPASKCKDERAMLDYPLGSLFVRYFYNRIHRQNPYTPRVISFEQYLDFAREHRLVDLLRIARNHYPFFIASLGPQSPPGRSRSSSQEDALQEAEFRALQRATQPADLHRLLNRLKVHPMAASKLALAKEMLKPMVRRALVLGGSGLVAFYLWLILFNLLQDLGTGSNVFIRATVFLLFMLLTLGGVVWAANWILLHLRRPTDRTVEICAQRAGHIARQAGVRMVLMGHTHMADLRPVASGRASYGNSGTWVALDSPWHRLIADARRMTFLWVRGEQVQCYRWSDPAGRIEPVPFFELADDSARERTAPDRMKLQSDPQKPLG